MSWDPIWEDVHSSREWGRYPPEELVRFVASIYKSFGIAERIKVKFLDVGCGSGSCSWFLAREGFSTTGMDGSKSAIERAKKRFEQEELQGKFVVGDFMSINFPNNSFDCVIDICAIQCNPLARARIIVSEVHRVLRPGGKFFSMVSAVGTSKLPYEGKGYVRFYKRDEVDSLFSKFKITNIETSQRTINNGTKWIIHWIVSAEKK